MAEDLDAKKAKKEKYEYVISHIDEATKNYWIKVYYQPVVRMINGELASFEALSRWIDPTYGFLSPGEFIPALEEAGLIYRLDTYMAEEVCRDYSEHKKAGLPVAPVSINISVSDFTDCDIFSAIEDSVKANDVPREMLNIEITESMFAKDAENFRAVLRSFRQAGYELWLDDFGSAYSSLNVLKDFEFDCLKIDMVFLSSFTDRSREIIRSVVDMAKKIGIKTLAEGVETKEHYDFLRSIGCEKVQGYYIGKPETYSDSLKNLENKRIPVEPDGMHEYYDKISRIDFLTDRPLCIVEDDETKFSILFSNESLINGLKALGGDTKELVENEVNSDANPIHKVIRNFVIKVQKSDREETATYFSGKNIIKMFARMIAKANGRFVYAMSMDVVQSSERENEDVRLDGILRNLYVAYDSVTLVDFEKKRAEELISNERNANLTEGMMNSSLRTYRGKINFVNYLIYPSERTRYLEFIDLKTARKRIEKAKGGALSTYFWTRTSDGTYMFKVHTIIAIPDSNWKQYLYCTKSAVLDSMQNEQVLLNDYFENNVSGKIEGRHTEEEDSLDFQFSKEELWDNLMYETDIKFFWKDKDRRFMGVSKSFLDYYELSSEDVLLGRTDEEMHWHINDEPYENAEKDILRTGKPKLNVPGKCLIRGVPKNIIASKAPIYVKGKIVGIIGYFIDVDEEEERANSRELIRTDSVTGCMNTHGIVETIIEYSSEYEEKGDEYAAIFVTVSEYERILSSYGKETGDEFLRLVSENILDVTGTSSAIGRFSQYNFVIFYKFRNKSLVEDISHRLMEKIQDIHNVGEYRCTVFPKISVAYASEMLTTDDFISRLFSGNPEG